MNLNATAHSTNPATMTGTLQSKIRLRPTRSMKANATSVKRKFVIAMDKEVSIGERKPTSAKMEAEKYIREFCGNVSSCSDLQTEDEFL